MASKYGWMADTGAGPLRMLIELQRKTTPGEKLAQVFEMADMMLRACQDRVRKDYPQAAEREIFLRAAALRLGAETVFRVYGWSPENGSA